MVHTNFTLLKLIFKLELQSQFHIHSLMVLSKWSHVVILRMKENTTKLRPTSKYVWGPLLFWLKDTLAIKDHFFNISPTWMEIEKKKKKINANENADIESKVKKLWYRERELLALNISLWKDYQIYWLTGEHDVFNR